MAFVPDSAFDNAAQISPSALMLYGYLCRWRNHKHQNCILNLPAAQSFLNLSKSQIYRLLDELRKRSWIITNGKYITLTMGDFSPVNRARRESQICEKESQIRDEKSHICDNTYISIQPLNQPLNSNQKTSKEKSQICDKCNDGFVWSKVDKMSRPCYDCNQATFF